MGIAHLTHEQHLQEATRSKDILGLELLPNSAHCTKILNALHASLQRIWQINLA